MVLDPERSLKAEKTIIIADTIKVITQIRTENGQLHHEKLQLEVNIRLLSFPNRRALGSHFQPCSSTYSSGPPPQL
jgi:hypothetical protein